MAKLLQNYGKFSMVQKGKSTISMANRPWLASFFRCLPEAIQKSGVGPHGGKRQVCVKILVDRTEFFRALVEVWARGQRGEHN